MFTYLCILYLKQPTITCEYNGKSKSVQHSITRISYSKLDCRHIAAETDKFVGIILCGKNKWSFKNFIH